MAEFTLNSIRPGVRRGERRFHGRSAQRLPHGAAMILRDEQAVTGERRGDPTIHQELAEAGVLKHPGVKDRRKDQASVTLSCSDHPRLKAGAALPRNGNNLQAIRDCQNH